jgi:hypothetical protein
MSGNMLVSNTIVNEKKTCLADKNDYYYVNMCEGRFSNTILSKLFMESFLICTLLLVD